MDQYANYKKNSYYSKKQAAKQKTIIKNWAEYPNRHFSKEEIKNAQQLCKNMIYNTPMREIQIKITVMLVIVRLLSKRLEISSADRGEKGSLYTVGRNIYSMENGTKVPQKVKNRTIMHMILQFYFKVFMQRKYKL